MSWNKDFGGRMHIFEKQHPQNSGMPISIKIKADSGCYHESCHPNAYKIIRQEIERSQNNEYEYVGHESGPEILTYLGVTAAGLSLLKSVIDIITVMIKARSEGQRQGDRLNDGTITLIVRKAEKHDEVIEERIITFHSKDQIDNQIIEKLLLDGCSKLEKSKGSKKKK